MRTLEIKDDKTVLDLARKVVATSTLIKNTQPLDKANRFGVEKAAAELLGRVLMEEGKVFDGVDVQIPEYPKTSFKVNLEADKARASKIMNGVDLDATLGTDKDKFFETKTILNVTDAKALLKELILAKKDPFKDGILTITVLKRDEVEGLAGTEIVESTLPRAEFLQAAAEHVGSLSAEGQKFIRELAGSYDCKCVVRGLPTK